MLLIDTYNVLHTSGILPPDLAGLDADGLADLVATSRYSDRAVKLVCDGARASPGSRRPDVEFLFAGPGAEADDLLERIIRTNSAPRRLLVISSDRRVITAARRRRAATLPSDRFLAQLAADRDRPQRLAPPAFTQDIPLDSYSVAHWMREFGLDPGDVDELKRRLTGRTPKPGQPKAPSAPAADPVPLASTGPVVEDPVLRAARQEWPGRIGLDDLDMRKWLGETQHHRPGHPIPPRGRGRRAGS